MSEYEVLLSGMSCGSCEKLIEREVEQHAGKIKSIDANSGRVVFDCPDDAFDGIIKALGEKGFPQNSAGDAERGDWSSVFSFINNSLFGEEGYDLENTVVDFSLVSLIILALFSAVLLFFLKDDYNLIKLAPLVFLCAVFAVATLGSYYHLRCYKKKMSCQNGMMVGMVSGMIIGFLSGALIGAANGMFVGSIVGIVLGVYFGMKLGKSCGVMGGLEGVMAGLMAGLMGAMSSVMLVNDNLVAALLVLFLVSLFILGGTSYMMRREAGSRSGNELNCTKSKFFFYCLAIFLVMLVIMLFGPKGGVTYV